MTVEFIDDAWEILASYENYLLLTDEKIRRVYSRELDRLPQDRIHLIPEGEASKNFEELKKIYDRMIELNLTRSDHIISLGGGVVGDLAGFAASSFKRGIKYIQLPTSLLAQVDSSVGGKTAINYGGYKNLIGAFYFPEKTYIDPGFIRTLEEREIGCGLAEVFKYGLIEDYEFFRYMVDNYEKAYEGDEEFLAGIIRRSVEIKSRIVQADSHERGLRMMLNFGHTLGHGIESFYGYDKYNHGEAVALGMIYESRLAYNRGLIDRDYFREILEGLGCLVEVDNFTREEVEGIKTFMEQDKKSQGGRPIFLLPIARSELGIFKDLEEEEIDRALLGDIYDY